MYGSYYGDTTKWRKWFTWGGSGRNYVNKKTLCHSYFHINVIIKQKCFEYTYYNGLHAHGCEWCTTACYTLVEAFPFWWLIVSYHKCWNAGRLRNELEHYKAIVDSCLNWKSCIQYSCIHPGKQWAIPHWVTSPVHVKSIIGINVSYKAR